MKSVSGEDFGDVRVWRGSEGDSERRFLGFCREKTSDTYCRDIRGVASGNISGKRRRMGIWGQSRVL